MPKSALNRRNLMLGTGAALVGAASSRPAFAARKVAPGGFSPEGLTKITAKLQEYIDSRSMDGLVTLLYRHGEIAQVNALGKMDEQGKVPMRRDGIFRLASMTKPVTCVAALTLFEQGKIGLNEAVDKWLPELAKPKVLNKADGPLNETHAAARSITLSDLLTHRSGIVGSSNTGPIAEANASGRAGNPNVDERMKRLGALPLAFEPGAHFNYGTSHEVLGALIERISGMPFADYLKKTIFDPLGMKDTGFWMPKEKASRIANLEPGNPDPTVPINFPSGSGGLMSTVDDYLPFARMLLGQGRLGDVRILTRPTVGLMTKNWLTPEQRKEGFQGNANFWAWQGYGLGVAVTDDVSRLGIQAYSSPGSFNWPGATGVWWRADPTEDMVLVYMPRRRAAQPQAPAGQAAAQAAAPEPAPGARGPARVPATITFGNLAYQAIEV